MRKYLLVALILTQAAFAESINDLTGTFTDIQTQEKLSEKFREGNNLSLNDTFSLDESKQRKPASTQDQHTLHVTEINGTFEN